MKVLLSIKPEYANSILDGIKKFEFRRRIHRDSRVCSVVIYATKPVGKVVGEFSIKDVLTEHPNLLWERTKDFSGITKEFFFEYFRDRNVGHAIEVNRAKRYLFPKNISEFLVSGVAPQSYAYIPA